jgi:hypothetical protein
VNAPRLRLVEIERREVPYRLRMPFRFGVTTATQGIQAFVRARIRLENGAEATGYSAEAVGAKWFDKNLALSDADNHDQLRKSLELAAAAYLDAGPATPFGLFADHYDSHVDACARLGLNPLIASYGQSLTDRAILDAVCRAHDVSFYEAMRSNLAGLAPHEVARDLEGVDLSRLFAGATPAAMIAVRHTVGLVDPIVASDLAAEDRVGDGLPETLEEVVAAYANRHFKIKIGGDAAADIDRLARIAGVLDRIDEPYFVTLDGNEQYEDAADIAAFYRRIGETLALGRLAASILYVEQPINRKQALARPVDELASLAPVIIDESDGELSAFPQARAFGYSGVSSKACKGIYKSMLNHARCRAWNGDGKGRYFMSAEDLTCQPGISLQQDLSLVNLLGLTHVERNAHHFIDGFSGSQREARAFLRAHPDLYHMQNGKVRLRIENGRCTIASLDCPGFGTWLPPDFDSARPMPAARWPKAEGGVE